MSGPAPSPSCSRCGRNHAPSGPGVVCPAEFGGGLTRPNVAPPISALKALAEPPPPSKSRPLQPGAFVGEYEIEGIIGRGGMGVVYRAVQPIIGKRVAIKVLDGLLVGDDIATKRFVREARAVNEIAHPNLVDIFSFGKLTDGRWYYVMEYLSGRNLGEVLAEVGKLTFEEAAPIFLDIGRALEAAHAKGIVHRDLKPENVVLVPQGNGRPPRAKLLDFGLAKLVQSDQPERADTNLTRAGSAVGTPLYMAPEQCLRKDVDGRTDIYSLGVMLFQTLCGRLPFHGDGLVEIWRQHVHSPPPHPRDFAPEGITPELDALILRMLAKDPAARVQNAGDLCDAIETLVGLNALAQVTRTFSGDNSIEIDLGELVAKDRVLQPTPVELTPEPAPVDIQSTKPAADYLRAELGLVINEPAFESTNPSQVSAIDIDLRVILNKDASPVAPMVVPDSVRVVHDGKPPASDNRIPMLGRPTVPVRTVRGRGVARVADAAWLRALKMALIAALLAAAVYVAHGLF